MPNQTTDNTMENSNNNRPTPKYNQNDIIIIRGNKKRHIYSSNISWSTEHNTYLYSVDYGFCLASEGYVLETDILRIADEEDDKLIPL